MTDPSPDRDPGLLLGDGGREPVTGTVHIELPRVVVSVVGTLNWHNPDGHFEPDPDTLRLDPAGSELLRAHWWNLQDEAHEQLGRGARFQPHEHAKLFGWDGRRHHYESCRCGMVRRTVYPMVAGGEIVDMPAPGDWMRPSDGLWRTWAQPIRETGRFVG